VREALRSSQIRATAAESALMIPNVIAMRGDYADLRMPVVIISGGDDQLIDVDQSARLPKRSCREQLHAVGHFATA
jgi:pimeloyl-ACP methyl ester carboxylesterase